MKKLSTALAVLFAVAVGMAGSGTASADQPALGYWLAGGDGGVFTYGSAGFLGSATGSGGSIVGMATGEGPYSGGVPSYDLVSSSGQVSSCNSTCGPGLHGSLPALEDRHVVGIAEQADGYWLADAAGEVYDLGDAGSYGSLAGTQLAAPITGIAASVDAGGYWLVGADGDVYAFGDARNYGSLGGLHPNQPIVGIAATPDGGGYWLVGADGGVFAYGDAAFYGSAAGLRLQAPVVGIRSTPDGLGYWLVAADGGVFTYGDAPFLGSAGGLRLDRPVVGMTVPCDLGGPSICPS